MTRQRRRLVMIIAMLVVIAAALGLILTGLRDNISFFMTPSEVLAEQIPAQRFRLGGMVREGSLARDGTLARFVVEDGNANIAVEFEGILPDIFAEGQGVVAEGTLNPDGVFIADRVLAKHDETYMPPELAERLQRDPGQQD